MLFDIQRLFDYKDINHTLIVNGLFDSANIYNKKYRNTEHITLYKVIDRQSVRPDKKTNICQKIQNNIESTIENFDTYESVIYTVYTLEKEDDSPRPYPVIKGQIKLEEYSLKGKLSRLDGPSFICSGFKYEDSEFNCEKQELWYVNGKLLPETLPKYINNKKVGNWSNVNIFKTLSFDMRYSKYILNYKDVG